jgi:hypothetical protein
MDPCGQAVFKTEHQNASPSKAIRMRHKCEALWHSCKSPLEVHSVKNIADSTSS